MPNVFMVLDRFVLLSGLSREESAAYLPVCSSALANILAHLKPGVDAEQHAEEIAHAAAAVAFYRFALISAAREEESFSAGNLTLRQDSEAKAQYARAVRDDALATLSDLAEDSGFLFGRM